MNKKERWFNALTQIGCIVCLKEFGLRSPPDIHHLHRNGNRRVDDFHTIPLCYYHHRAGLNNDMYASRHPWKKEFEKRYGDEWDLFKDVQEMVRELDSKTLAKSADPLG